MYVWCVRAQDRESETETDGSANYGSRVVVRVMVGVNWAGMGWGVGVGEGKDRQRATGRVASPCLEEEQRQGPFSVMINTEPGRKVRGRME